MVKLQGDFHFSFGTSTKRSEQPQGDFFARIALQREPCMTHDLTWRRILLDVSGSLDKNIYKDPAKIQF